MIRRPTTSGRRSSPGCSARTSSSSPIRSSPRPGRALSVRLFTAAAVLAVALAAGAAARTEKPALRVTEKFVGSQFYIEGSIGYVRIRSRAGRLVASNTFAGGREGAPLQAPAGRLSDGQLSASVRRQLRVPRPPDRSLLASHPHPPAGVGVREDRGLARQRLHHSPRLIRSPSRPPFDSVQQ